MKAPEALRLPAAYRYTLNLDGQDLAWEFLRRNRRFREEVGATIADTELRAETTPRRSPAKRTVSSVAQPSTAPAAPPTRWGLTFRPEPCASG